MRIINRNQLQLEKYQLPAQPANFHENKFKQYLLHEPVASFPSMTITGKLLTQPTSDHILKYNKTVRLLHNCLLSSNQLIAVIVQQPVFTQFEFPPYQISIAAPFDFGFYHHQTES